MVLGKEENTSITKHKMFGRLNAVEFSAGKHEIKYYLEEWSLISSLCFKVVPFLKHGSDLYRLSRI